MAGLVTDVRSRHAALDEVLVVGVVVRGARQLLDEPLGRQAAAATPHQSPVAHLPVTAAALQVVDVALSRRDHQRDGGARHRAAGLE